MQAVEVERIGCLIDQGVLPSEGADSRDGLFIDPIGLVQLPMMFGLGGPV